jgi:hypothetical protein
METDFQVIPLNFTELTLDDLKLYAEALNLTNLTTRNEYIEAIKLYYSNNVTMKSTKCRRPNTSLIKDKISEFMNDFEVEIKDTEELLRNWLKFKEQIDKKLNVSKLKIDTFINNIKILIDDFEKNINDEYIGSWNSLKNNILSLFDQNSSSSNINVKRIKIINNNISIKNQNNKINIICDPYLSFSEELKEKRIICKINDYKINLTWEHIHIQKFFYLENVLAKSIIMILENIAIMIISAYDEYLIKFCYNSSYPDFKFGKEESYINLVEKDVIKFFSKNYSLENLILELNMEFTFPSNISKNLKYYLCYILTHLVEYESLDDMKSNFEKLDFLISDNIIDGSKISYIRQKLLSF